MAEYFGYIQNLMVSTAWIEPMKSFELMQRYSHERMYMNGEASLSKYLDVIIRRTLIGLVKLKRLHPYFDQSDFDALMHLLLGDDFQSLFGHILSLLRPSIHCLIIIFTRIERAIAKYVQKRWNFFSLF